MKIPTLKNRQAFQAVRTYGKSSRDPALVIQGWRFDLSATHPSAFGWVVSKQFGNAVLRNTMKRRIRAILANELSCLIPEKGWYWIFVPRSSLCRMSHQALVHLIRKQCSDVRIKWGALPLSNVSRCV